MGGKSFYLLSVVLLSEFGLIQFLLEGVLLVLQKLKDLLELFNLLLSFFFVLRNTLLPDFIQVFKLLHLLKKVFFVSLVNLVEGFAELDNLCYLQVALFLQT